MSLAAFLEEGKSSTQWFNKDVSPIWQKHLVPLGPFQRYVELGTFEGDSLLWAAEHLLDQDCGLGIGVDRWAAKRSWQHCHDEIERAKALAEQRVANWNQSHYPGLELQVRDSAEFLIHSLHDKIEPFDCIYVDAGHLSEVALTDMVLAWRLLAEGGVMIVDDVHLFKGKRLGKTACSGEAYCSFLCCFGHLLTVLYQYRHQAAIIKRPQEKK